jgi:ribosomal protein S18
MCFPFSDKLFQRKQIDFTVLIYNDFPVLVQYLDQFGRMLHKRDTGLSEKHQKIIKKLIKYG